MIPLDLDAPGSVILVDKPLGWTSFDVVSKVRHLLSVKTGNKKLKIGHAGTLDPLATGLLILCTGTYTKRIAALQDMPKTYTGTVTFGATTPSYDREKPYDQTFPVSHLTDQRVQAALPLFIGTIQQLPPVFSAVKQDGKRLYKHARAGDTPDIQPRTVHIETFSMGALRHVQDSGETYVIRQKKGMPISVYPDYADGFQADFEVRCHKGTYIRSLAFDLGLALQTGAYLSALRRTESGGTTVEEAWALDALIAHLEQR
jgi:tRNA pseudouridine55 synthase